MSSQTYLLDTNCIIEAVDTGVWPAITGGLTIETVEECRAECGRGDRLSSGYVTVSDADIDRMTAIHPVSGDEVAGLILFDGAAALDPGERDLFAHALSRPDNAWVIASPDRASVRLAVELDWGGRLLSLEQLVDKVGARGRRPLREHFGTRWLSAVRTEILLGL